MQVDDPPYLSVGTAVSAKYKGAFCEAKVSKVVRIVKCKVTYKMGLGTATVSDEQVKGTLRVGHTVQAKHPDKKDFAEATITKIQDCSQYTVVFDDGDITTLRRSALCLKSGRHFNESETLDQLPLTHPEHFGNPVMGGRRGRRNRQLEDDSSEGEIEEENEPDLEGYTTDIGRVVSVEATDKKRSKDNWFPGLVVIPFAQPTVRINVKDEYLVRSFKDGRYYTVPKKEVSDFNREMGDKVESSVLAEAVNKAVKYLDNNELPIHWERNSLFNMQQIESEDEENDSDSSDDEPNEEKDRFVAQLYKFMDDSGTPLNKSPMVASRDVDLHGLFRVVHKFGGYNRVTNQNKWKTVASRLKFPNNQITFNQLKSVYKKCLLSYESFYRTLGVTMLNHTRSTKKNRGRPLMRDKDRSTPVNIPKDEEPVIEKKEEEKVVVVEEIPSRKKDFEKKRKIEVIESSDSNSSDATDQSESQPGPSRDVGRPKRIEKPTEKPKKPIKSATVIEKTIKVSDAKKEEDDRQTQLTRSRVQTPKIKDIIAVTPKKKEVVVNKPVEVVTVAKAPTPSKFKKIEEEKKRGRKKLNPDDKPTVEIALDPCSGQSISIGDKLKVYYGPTHESKVTYEAKVIEIDKDPTGPVYLVHYTGWNTRYDEWITANRIAENLSATTKAKRLKYGVGKSGTRLGVGKRGRGMSITGRSTATSDAPRSTTPSSVTSSSSRTKSPATPATRSSSRQTRQENKKPRRASAQTDISNHSDTESDLSETESEKSRTTKTTSKSDDNIELKTYKRKPPKPKMLDKSKEKNHDSENSKTEDQPRPKRAIRNAKKSSPEKSNEDSDEETGSNPPKGRDFDLNQIISELKGFNKAVKAPTALENADKDVLSSSDDSNLQPASSSSAKLDSNEDKPKTVDEEESPSSEDIYEFKEPEPFEFESRTKLIDDKSNKKRIPRLFEELDSPKRKAVMSPEQEVDRKEYKKTPMVRPKPDSEEDEEEEEEGEEEEEKKEDPFDKLVESPSFNVVKSAPKPLEIKPKVVKNLLEEPFGSLFRELPESGDTNSTDIDLSDSESQQHPVFSRDEELFSDTFSKSSPDRNTLDFVGKSDDLKKECDDFEAIRASINRAIEGDNSSDEDDLMITPSSVSYQVKKKDVEEALPFETTQKPQAECSKDEIKDESSSSSALPESETSILKSICSQPLSTPAKSEDTKEYLVKTGCTKIADTLLQKFSSIKSKPESDTEVEEKKQENEKSPAKTETPPVKVDVKKATPVKSDVPEVKKRRKVLSRAYIEESDSDSSDPDQLVIARSDEDSQTNSLDKSDAKLRETSPIPGRSTDDYKQEPRNFQFDKLEEKVSRKEPPQDSVKEEEPDSQLHSLLLCEETIPRSPAPLVENIGVTETKSKGKTVHEMPFASAPGSSSNNNKNILLNNEHKQMSKAPAAPAAAAATVRESREAATAVIDNTPPTTPESSISNLSPREDREDLSPNVLENDSCKSFEAEPEFGCGRKRRNSSINKPPLYSDDSQMTMESKKMRDDSTPAPCRKRRKSSRTTDDVPVKRGRRPLNRSRHNSDSDDNSEHSISTPSANLALSLYDRASKSPRPSKYNFFVEFDPSLNSGQRIAVLQQKLTELRKTYAEVKTELATVERRRKKIRRREREALKAAKQEIVCG